MVISEIEEAQGRLRQRPLLPRREVDAQAEGWRRQRERDHAAGQCVGINRVRLGERGQIALVVADADTGHALAHDVETLHHLGHARRAEVQPRPPDRAAERDRLAANVITQGKVADRADFIPVSDVEIIPQLREGIHGEREQIPAPCPLLP